jgi:hypothetical protein
MQPLIAEAPRVPLLALIKTTRESALGTQGVQDEFIETAGDLRRQPDPVKRPRMAPRQASFSISHG